MTINLNNLVINDETPDGQPLAKLEYEGGAWCRAYMDNHLEHLCHWIGQADVVVGYPFTGWGQADIVNSGEGDRIKG